MRLSVLCITFFAATFVEAQEERTRELPSSNDEARRRRRDKERRLVRKVLQDGGKN
jgi:hypothetical protein